MNRAGIDAAIVGLWLFYRDASDEPESLTEQDMDVWGAVTRHEAVQGPLQRALEKDKEPPHD